jgi:hypothetical protein
MTWFKLMLCALVASAVLAACSGAPTAEEIEGSLKTATTVAVPDAKLQSIEVVNPERSAATWRWTARVGDKVYACDADDRMRLPSCEAII